MADEDIANFEKNALIQADPDNEEISQDAY